MKNNQKTEMALKMQLYILVYHLLNKQNADLALQDKKKNVKNLL